MEVKVKQIPSQPTTRSRAHLQQLPQRVGLHRFLVDIVQIVLDHVLVVTYFESAVQPVLHDGDKLLVRQQPVAVLVEDRKHRVDQVRVQLRAGADFDGAPKFV